MKQKLYKYLIIVISITAFSQVKSQTCGFGCLGLSGVYGGYSIQQYKADGLNNYLNSQFPFQKLDFNFSEGKGLRFGMNVVRADYGNFFFTFKGFYQFIIEEQTQIVSSRNIRSVDAKLEMNNWGVAIDLGIPLIGFIDWKIIDGSINFFTPKVTIKKRFNDIVLSEDVYSPTKVGMGFSVGSGLIFNIVKDYISIEATGRYNFIEIENLSSDVDGSLIPSDGNSKLINKGGIQAIIQLNVGIPL